MKLHHKSAVPRSRDEKMEEMSWCSANIVIDIVFVASPLRVYLHRYLERVIKYEADPISQYKEKRRHFELRTRGGSSLLSWEWYRFHLISHSQCW